MNKPMIYIASDHRGYDLKNRFVSWLRDQGDEVNDLGPDNGDRCDASVYAVKLAKAMRDEPDARGVLICGTGQVMAMTANRFRHIRAALCLDATMARLAREHNDANVLVVGAAIVGDEVARDCLDIFMKTSFLGGRYAERCRILADLGGL